METPAWILVIFLSVALLIAIILAIALLISLIKLAKEIKKVVISGQGIVDNVKDMTSVGGLVKTFVNRYTDSKKKGGHNEKNQEKE
jgi:hypothetical protein